MDQWLIRTAQNILAGPYSAEQVRELLMDGQLSLQDEICPANGYWIYLYERDEVKRLLGVDVPSGFGDEEITETQTETATEIAQSQDKTDENFGDALPELSEPKDEATGVMSGTHFRKFQPKRKIPGSALPRAYQIDAKGEGISQPQSPFAGDSYRRRGAGPMIEKPVLWWAIVGILMTGALGIVYAILYLFRGPGS